MSSTLDSRTHPCYPPHYDGSAPNPREVHVVFYAPHPASRTPSNRLACNSFDALLDLLERNLVSAIEFDPFVGGPERAYVSRWAKLFHPSIEILTSENSEAAFFSIQRN